SMLVEFTDTAIDLDEDEEVRGYAPRKRKGGGLLGRVRDMGRSLGKSMTEFKKGMKGIEDEPGRGKPFRVTPTSTPKFDDTSGSEAVSGEDTTPDYGTQSMFSYTVEEGQRVLMVQKDGRMEVIVGP